MKIKNGEIKFYSDWLLNNLTLAGKKNRMRVRFIDILSAKQQEFQKFNQQLIKDHSRHDNEGNIIILNPDENGFGEADIIDKVAFKKEQDELIMEEFVIEENETNKDMLLTIKEAIGECPTAWVGEPALHYEVVCRLFDEIYEEGVKDESQN